MRVVLQRVKHASVHVDGQETGSIGQGFLILLGVSDTDDESIADKMADKICKKGNRPSFTDAGAPDHANRLYEYFMERCRMHVEKVAHGEFGADMKVDLLNDGPFTLMLDSKDLLTK